MSTTPETGVEIIDCQYMAPEHAAAYLIVEGDRAAFVDNNTVHAVPLLMKALSERGLGADAVEFIIITHLHLDHAGGTSMLAEQCPNASVLAHPRAVRHLVNPARLVAAVKDVYGVEYYERMYAPINPIDAARVRAVEDGETISFGSRTLTFLHTRGHAKHHICIHDSGSNGVFTGDTFGVGFLPRRTGARPFMVCSTAPSDFDPPAAKETIQRIVDTKAERAYLSHYGELTDVAGGAVSLLNSLEQIEAIVREAMDSERTGESLLQLCKKRVREAARAQAEACQTTLTDEEWQLLDEDLTVDAQGLALYAAALRDEQNAK